VADLWSIISSNYTTVGLNALQSTGKYANVDPTSYQGTWSGKYADNSSFSFQISNVNGFKAKVKYQSGATVQYQDVLIKNASFRIGNSKFTLQQNGVAQVKTVMTNASTGANTLNTANASRS
jgi:hypothetical protein